MCGAANPVVKRDIRLYTINGDLCHLFEKNLKHHFSFLLPRYSDGRHLMDFESLCVYCELSLNIIQLKKARLQILETTTYSLNSQMKIQVSSSVTKEAVSETSASHIASHQGPMKPKIQVHSPLRPQLHMTRFMVMKHEWSACQSPNSINWCATVCFHLEWDNVIICVAS